MPCSLPTEILDLIIDSLRNEPATLKTCCVVNKSWIHRTQKHLFANVGFFVYRCVRCWSETFPDPANSPTCHTRTLVIFNSHLVTATGAGIISAFRNVIHLRVDTYGWPYKRISIVPLRGLPPVLRSLDMAFASASLPKSEVLGLICSLPLLEDLSLESITRRNEGEGEVEGVFHPSPSPSPRLSGFLELRMMEGIQSTALRLVDLPSGLHFTMISVWCHSEGDVRSTMDLVSRCSNTLESLDVAYYLPGASPSALVPR